MIAKQYKNPRPAARTILDKELVDQFIYNTRSDQDRLLLELQGETASRWVDC